MQHDHRPTLHIDLVGKSLSIDFGHVGPPGNAGAIWGFISGEITDQSDLTEYVEDEIDNEAGDFAAFYAASKIAMGGTP